MIDYLRIPVFTGNYFKWRSTGKWVSALEVEGFWVVFCVFYRKLLDFRCFFSVICAAGGQQEHHTVTQARSAGVIKSGANRRQHFQMIIDDRLLIIGFDGWILN